MIFHTAHKWFIGTHKDETWMFRDWDVVIFDSVTSP
jgi:hypothetical protein